MSGPKTIYQKYLQKITLLRLAKEVLAKFGSKTTSKTSSQQNHDQHKIPNQINPPFSTNLPSSKRPFAAPNSHHLHPHIITTGTAPAAMVRKKANHVPVKEVILNFAQTLEDAEVFLHTPQSKYLSKIKKYIW